MFLFACVRIGLSAYLVYEIRGCLSCSLFASQIFPGSHFHISACMFFVNHLASAYLNIKNFFNHQRQEHSLMNIHIFPLLRLVSRSLPCSKSQTAINRPHYRLWRCDWLLLPRAFFFFFSSSPMSCLVPASSSPPTSKKKNQQCRNKFLWLKNNSANLSNSPRGLLPLKWPPALPAPTCKKTKQENQTKQPGKKKVCIGGGGGGEIK